MKRLILIAVVLIVIGGLLFAGCGKAEPTGKPTATTGKPVSGGILRIIASSGPQVLSYTAIMGPGDRSAIFPAAEALIDTTTERGAFTSGVEPVLCEKVDVDAKNLTITYHIRKGVKFSDGSALTADVARWNLQQVIDAGAMPYMSYFKGFRVTDENTLVIDLNAYNNQMMPTWGWWTAMYSKAAWDAASGGDLEKGKEWARTNIVGTGPFTLKEFKRDVSISWVKNPNYWRKDRPYLDGITVTYIPDAVAARAAFEAGEADIWGAPAKDAQELIAKSFVKQSGWPTLPWGIWPNTANPGSKFQDKNLREALDYAIDKVAIAQALGHGMYISLKAIPWEGEWGYDATSGRAYDAAKAKELMAAAGYSTSKPLKVTLLTSNVFGPDPIDACTMVKQYLDAVGFDVTLDIADAGRYFGTIYGKTNIPAAEQDLSWYFAGGNDTNYLQTYIRWFSNEPFTWLSYLGRTSEQVEMDKQAMAAVEVKDQVELAKKVMRYLTDNALIIPVYGVPQYTIQQPYVHSTQFSQGFVRWQTEEVWMGAH